MSGFFLQPIRLLLAVCLVAQLSTAVPFGGIQLTSGQVGQQGQQVCAQTCNQLNGLIQYQPGYTYTYRVNLDTKIDSNEYDLQQEKVQISAISEVSVYAPCEMVLRLRQVELSGIKQAPQMARQLEEETLHFAYDDGQVVDVCASLNEHTWALNVKKSIISALQMSSTDLSQKKTLIESDISGQCETIYEPIESYRNTFVVRKTKELNRCAQRHQFHVGFFPRSYGLDQVLRSALPMSEASYECTQKVTDQIVTEARCVDRQKMWPMNMEVKSQITCQLVDTKQTLTVPRMDSEFRKHRLTMSHQYKSRNNEIGEPRHYSVHEVEQLLRLLCQNVADSVQIDVPQQFGELIRAFQSPLSVQEQHQLYESVRSGQLCQSGKLFDLFLDASALAGTEGSTQVLIQAYQQNQIGQFRASYLFSLLSFAQAPSVQAGQQLVQFLQQQNQQQLPRGVIFGVTGFVHNLRRYAGQQQYHVVDTLVQQLQKLLVERVEQYVQQPEQVTYALTYLYALKNVGLYGGYQQPLVQRLQRLLEQYRGQQYTNEFRVVVVRVLVDGADDQVRQYLLENVFQDEQQSVELRAEAYRSILYSGTTRQQLEQIQSYLRQVEQTEQGAQLANFVRSHQANLRQSSDVHKQTVLPVDAPTFEPPQVQPFGITRNYEFSYLNQALGAGVTVESDVVYEPHGQSEPLLLPESVSLNLTVPVVGQEFQVVELHFHQEGLEPAMREHIRKVSRSSKMTTWKAIKEIVDILISNGNEILTQNPQVRLLVQVAFDGKTVLLVDEQDFYQGGEQQGLLKEIFETLHKRLSVDDAFAVAPVDFVGQVSTVNGLPVQVRLNSTVVFGLKTELNLDARDLSNSVFQFVVLPSVASQTELAVEFYAGSERKSVEYINRFYSAPQINFSAQLSQGRHLHFQVNMPQQRYVLARFESQVYTRNVHGQRIRRAVAPLDRNYHVCTQSTRQLLGVVFCYDLAYENNQAKHFAQVAFEVTVEKADPQLTSYELHTELPYSLEQIFSNKKSMHELRRIENAPFRFTFNTPGSQVDREIIFELELPQQGRHEQQQARLRIQTPWKRILTQAYIKNQPKEKAINVELSVDEKKYLQMEIGMEALERGEKIEYRPRVILSMGTKFEPIHLNGVVSLTKGKKSILFITLNDAKKDKQFVKATLVKVGRISDKTFLASADCLVNVADLNGKLAATFERSDRVIKMEMKSEYLHPKTGNRETANLAFKCQNLSSGKMFKIENHGLVQLSQYPRYNINFEHNIVLAAKEYFEHDLKCGWDNESEQIRLYQLIKVNGQRGKYDIETKSICVYKPENIDYEIKGTCALVGFGINGQKRYNMILNGQSRGQSEGNFRAELSYSHLSKSPLKMKMRAAVKSVNVDFVYSDEIEEKSPNNYEGHMLVQLTPEKQYTAVYNYDMTKSNQNEQNHELKIELNDQKSRSTIRHHGLLKLSNTQLFVQSKLSADDEAILDGELSYNKHGASYGKFNHYGSNSRAHVELDPHSSPRSYQLALQKKNLKHETSLQYEPATMLDIRSKTRRDNDNILSVITKVSPNQVSHFAITSKPFEGEVHYNVIDPSEKKAKVKFEIPNSWSHDSDLTMRPEEQQVHFKSLTKRMGDELVDIDAKYHPAKEHYIHLKSPIVKSNFHSEHESPLKKINWDWQTGKYNQEGSYHYQPESMHLDTRTMKGDKNIADLKYQWENNVHHMKFHSDDLLKMQGECSDWSEQNRKPYGKLGFTLKDRKGQVYEHQTNWDCDRDSDIFGIDSQTKKQNRNFAHIKAHIDRNGQDKSYANMHFGENVMSNIEVTPFRSGRFEIDSPKYEHLTEFNYDPVESYFGGVSKRNWKLSSATTDKRSQKKYLIHGQHESDKQTNFKVDIPQMDSQFSYHHPEDNVNKHSMLFDFNSKIQRPDIRHHSELTYHMQDRPYVELKSQTTRQNGDNYLDLNGIYRHRDIETPSKLDVKIGKSIFGSILAQPFNENTKTFSWAGQMHDKQGEKYNHHTQVKYEPFGRALEIDSKTDKSGRMLANLKTYLTTDLDKKSFFTLKGDNDLSAQFEVEPRIRRALIDLNVQPYEHKTHIFNDIEDKVNGGYKLFTSTLKNKQSLFDLDAAINRPTTRSHLLLKACPGGCFEAKVEAHPEKRFGKLSFNSDSIKHHSMFELPHEQQKGDQKVYLKSQTEYMDKPLAHLEARMRGIRGANEIDCTVPQFRLKSNLDWQNKEAAFDYVHRAGRHLLGSVAFNQDLDTERTFRADFAWDVDRNPNSKVVVEVNAKRLAAQEQSSLSGVAGEVLFVMQAEYAQNKFIVRQQFMPRNTFAYPIKSSISFVAPNQYDSFELVYSHQRPSDTSYECKLYFLNQQQVKYGVEVTTSLQEDKFQFITNLICQNDPTLQQSYKIFGVQRAPGKYHVEASAVRAFTEKYEVVVDVDHQYQQQVNGKVEFRMPNQETSFTNFYLDFVKQKVFLEVVNDKEQKQLALEGQITDELVELTVSAQFFYYPLVQGKFRYIPHRHLIAELQLDGETKFQTLYKYTGSVYGPEFNLLAKIVCVYTPNLELYLDGKQSEQGYNVNVIGKQDANEVLHGTFKRFLQQQGGFQGFSLEGYLNRANGVEIAKALLKSSYNAEIIRTNLEFEPNQNEISVLDPLYVVVNGRAQEGGLQVLNVKVTRGQTQDLVEADFVVKIGSAEHRHYILSVPIPERVESTIRFAPLETQFTLRCSLNEYLQVSGEHEQSRYGRVAGQRLVSKIRNQLLLGVDEQIGGFEIVTTQFGRSQQESVEHDIKLYSPASDRVLQYICAHEFTPEVYYIRGQFKSDIRQREPVYNYVAKWEQQQEQYVANLEYNSVYFTNPKTVNVVVRVPTERRPVDVVAQIQLGERQADALTVEAVLEQKPSDAATYFRKGFNSTVHFALRSADNLVNLGLDGHISDSSFGVIMHHMNRHGVFQQAYCLFHLRENGQFEIEYTLPTVRYVVNGQYRNKESTNDLLIDCVVNQYVLKRRSNYGQDQQYRVHVETQGKCVRADIQDVQNQETYHQVNACVDTDRANIVNIAVDSVRDGEKTSDLNIRLDTRSVMNILKLYLKVNPQYARQIVSTIVQGYRYPSSLGNYEFVRELAHQARVIVNKLYDSQYSHLLIQEFQPILDELNINFDDLWQQLQYYLTEPSWEMIQQVCEVIERIYRPVYRVYSQYCQRIVRSLYANPVIRRILNTLTDVESWENLAEVAAQRVVQALEHTHRFVMSSTSGQFLRRLLPDMPRAVYEVYNTVLGLIGQTIKYSTTYENVASHLNHIAQEMFRYSDSHSINWNRVKESVSEVMKAILTPFNYKTSTRVVVFDPQEGELQVEIYNLAATHRRLFGEQQTMPHTMAGKQNQTGFLSRYFYKHDNTIRDHGLSRKRRAITASDVTERIWELNSNQSLIHLDCSWVEESLVRNEMINSSQTTDQWLVFSNSTLGKLETRKTLHLYRVSIVNRILVHVQQHLERRERVELKLPDLHLSIEKNLQWNLYDTSLLHNDSIVVLGKSIKVSLNRTITIDGSQFILELTLLWTPMRKLVSIEANFVIPKLDRAPISVHVSLENLYRPPRNQTLVFMEKAATEILDELFLDSVAFFNQTTLNEMTRRESICGHWLRYSAIKPTALEWSLCNSVHDACNMASYFVRTQGLVRVPNQCLACSSPAQPNHNNTEAKFGSRSKIYGADLAEVILLLDGSCSSQMSQGNHTAQIRLMLQVTRLTKAIEKEFRSKNVRASFLMVTPDSNGKYRIVWPEFERKFSLTYLLTAPSRPQPVQVKNISNLALNESIFMPSLWKPDGRHSLDFLHLFPYPTARTSRHFILIDCRTGAGSTCAENEVDFNTARTMFLYSNMYFHVVTGMGLSQQPMNSPKLRRVIGLDWQQVYFDNETSTSTLAKNSKPIDLSQMSRLLRNHILPQRDVCQVLALETNGTVFTHKTLKAANRHLLARRIAANHQHGQCQRCDCMLARDHLSTQEECTLCQPRPHTLLNPYKEHHNRNNSLALDSKSSNNSQTTQHHDWHLNAAQEWTDEDEKHFQELNGGVSSEPQDPDNK